jgi:hypothetical protein
MFTWFKSARIQFCKDHPFIIGTMLALVLVTYLLKAR